MIEIPKEKTIAVPKGPKSLLLFSKPKTGKSSALAKLEDNFIIEMDPGGASYIDYWGVDVNELSEKNNISRINVLKEIAKGLKALPKKPKYLTLDTVTELEDIVLPLAVDLYKATPMGKNYEGTDVRMLPNGSGYMFTRLAFQKIVSTFTALADNIILVGHLREKFLEREGREFTAMDIDLAGKNKSITAAEAHAIGYLYRKGNQNYISFETKDDIICGARPEHLRNKEILLSELSEDGVLTTYWDKIYI